MPVRGPWCFVHSIAVLALAALAVALAGCGYISEPLPPALHKPMQVTDLAAVQRGDKIIVQFTIPKITTENLPIQGDPNTELRIGTAPAGAFELTAWEKTSEVVTNIIRRKPRAYVEVPIAKHLGSDVVLAVRVNGPKGQNAGWSNFVRLPIVPALPMPEALAAADGPDSVVLTWRAAAPEFRVFRKLVAEPSWSLIGDSVQTSVYTDSAIEYGKTYQYFVQSVRKTGAVYAESEISTPITFAPVDRFAPAVPAGLTAIPSVRSVELVWQRNTEKDLASYSVYRDGAKIASGLTAPAYSDADARPGTRYSYQVTASDMAGNESAKSPAVTAAIP